MKFAILLALLFVQNAHSKQIALTFDDAPIGNSKHYSSQKRTNDLIRKLKSLNVPPAMIFANPCKRSDSESVVAQLRKYKNAGHLIGNHTCSHPRLDEVGYEAYSKDAAEADRLLTSLFGRQKYFRFPYLNEGNDLNNRDRMRQWLKENNYRNGLVSVDDDDYLFSFKINEARRLGKKIDYKKIETLLVEHLVGAARFSDELALKTIGRSPKHVILLHEMDATVMFIESIVKALRADGWEIIDVEEAFADPMYLELPKNTYANNGFLSQLYLEKTGERVAYGQFEKVKAELNRILGL